MFLTATIILKQTHSSLVGYLMFFRLAIAFSNSNTRIYTATLSFHDGFSCVRYLRSKYNVVVYRSFMSVMWVAPFLAEHFVYSFACLY